MEQEKKYVSTLSMTLMCIGSIIGGGVFGSLCIATGYVGPGICFAFLLAALTVFAYTVPGVVPSSTIPSAAGYYTAINRLISPYLGALEFANLITLCVLDVALASTFAEYFCMIVPANPVVVTCGVIVVLTLIAYCGMNLGTAVQNVLTVILVLTILMFIVLGMKHVDPANFTIAKAFDVSSFGSGRTTFFAAVALLVNCCGGGNAGVHMAPSMKNPRRGVMTSFIVSTSAVTILYMFFGAIVTGINPNAGNVGEVAQTFMGQGLFVVFIIGGALTAVYTTANCVTLAGAFRFEALARDKVLPEAFGRKNRFGQNGLGLIVLGICGLAIAIFNLPIGTLFGVLSTISLVMNVVNILPVFKVEKAYPHSYAHSPLKMPKWLIYVFSAFAIVFCLYEAYALILENSASVWIALVIVLALFYVYFFVRKAYLKSKGIDLLAVMTAPIPEWVEKEEELAKLDDAEGK